jgi:hypothetical protein
MLSGRSIRLCRSYGHLGVNLASILGQLGLDVVRTLN